MIHALLAGIAMLFAASVQSRWLILCLAAIAGWLIRG